MSLPTDEDDDGGFCFRLVLILAALSIAAADGSWDIDGFCVQKVFVNNANFV